MDKRISKTPVIEVTVRIEPNHSGTHIIWSMWSSDGTRSSGLAKSAPDAMRDSAAFVDAMLQPRVGGLLVKPEIKAVK